jgi:nucleotide-binding universal stress UspA family protein
MPAIEKILVPMDFSPCSDEALRFALEIAGVWGAEVEVLHVWSLERGESRSAIFAETPEGEAMERRLTHAEYVHGARVSGRLEFGDDASRVILAILEREGFDLVVMGRVGDGGSFDGHVASHVTRAARCTVVTLPPV